jgi:acetylornithine/N-succinyldiaminopimelate aminotransferase
MNMDINDVKQLYSSYLFQNYAREDVCFERGEKEFLWDIDGRRFIDLVAGIAVNALGHNHPAIVEAATAQVRKLVHVSNLYYVKEQTELGEAIASVAPWPLALSLFVNSGAEANEAALKLASRHTKRSAFVAAKNSFHGRTAGALSATGQQKYQVGFEPLLSKAFHFVEYGDVEQLKGAVTEQTAALILEPIQGEGGIIVPPTEFMRAARDVCTDKGALFIMDEVQTGWGRTGRMFGFQHFGIVPDVVACAKALGGGFPIGAIVSTAEIAKSFPPGSHGTTFGGNPLGCAIATAVVNTIRDQKLPERAAVKGEEWMTRLRSIAQGKNIVTDVRGKGLMIGVEMGEAAKDLQRYAFSRQQLVNVCASKVLRLVPPLIVGDDSMRAFSETFSAYLVRH